MNNSRDKISIIIAFFKAILKVTQKKLWIVIYVIEI
jgi:hypothetical protein